MLTVVALAVDQEIVTLVPGGTVPLSDANDADKAPIGVGVGLTGSWPALGVVVGTGVGVGVGTGPGVGVGAGVGAVTGGTYTALLGQTKALMESRTVLHVATLPPIATPYWAQA